MACLLLTALGAWAIFSHGPIERLFQIFATTITLSMFCFFALFNAETFQNAGLETSFLYGSVYPIVLSAVALVSQSVLFVTAKPSKR